MVSFKFLTMKHKFFGWGFLASRIIKIKLYIVIFLCLYQRSVEDENYKYIYPHLSCIAKKVIKIHKFLTEMVTVEVPYIELFN